MRLSTMHDCICDQIQKVDKSIRYVGLTNKMGTKSKIIIETDWIHF